MISTPNGKHSLLALDHCGGKDTFWESMFSSQMRNNDSGIHVII